ncbi:MAG: phosphatidylglycerophosphatase A [Rhodospirillaceae bacterium]|nr:phosphatidylglycerophosphatase A [Rhodospirillaceae bacterium]
MMPAMVLATWFWCGLFPKAPGTVGSLGALPIAWAVLAFGGGWVWLAVAAAAATAIGTWATAAVLRRSSVKDPGFVVIDEVAGQWIALLPVALFPAMGGAPGPDPVLFAGGFIAFRLFDILKPWPVSWADRSVAGAWGVMLDDLIAGAYAAGVVYVVGRIMTGGG